MCEIFNSDVTPISEDVRRLPKVSDDSRRFPKISEHCRRWSDDFRSYQLFWQLNCWTIFCQSWLLNVHLIGLWARNSHLSARREKLLRMREISILDRQAWDSRIMRESWEVCIPLATIQYWTNQNAAECNRNAFCLWALNLN